MTRSKMFGWGAVLLALSSAAAGCADHVQSPVTACPCDHGSVCCTSGVCAPDENSCTTATAALSALSAGRWTGYVENFTFPSGSDALDLTLQVGSDDTLSGQLIIGQGTVPAPPTDGNVGWPPAYDYTSVVQLMEGFAYHLSNIRWTALRLRFDIDFDEPWDAWCRFQQPVPSERGGFVCVDNFYGSGVSASGCYVNDANGAEIQVSCDKLFLCGRCACTDSGCAASLGYPSLSIDVALQGDRGDGSILSLGLTDGRNVRLIRASN